MKIGIGYDVHPLKRGRRLILGGVEIKGEYGLEGYSDADVLIHAISDALLGALGEGDIGYHYPDTDPQYKDISSLKILSKTQSLIKKRGYRVSNIDSLIILERPKLSPYKKMMQKNIAGILEIEEKLVNVKASTNEGLGFIGREEGIAAHAVCALSSEISR
ncbi:MAG: 2-C-methyl-D-erythritol 2,4-cyclodiphosphate synthase [Nitrospirota bacterium]